MTSSGHDLTRPDLGKVTPCQVKTGQNQNRYDQDMSDGVRSRTNQVTLYLVRSRSSQRQSVQENVRICQSKVKLGLDKGSQDRSGQVTFWSRHGNVRSAQVSSDQVRTWFLQIR